MVRIRYSIFFKFITALISGIFLLMFLFSIYMYTTEKNKLLDSMKNEITVLLDRMVNNIYIPLWHYDEKVIKEIINYEAKNINITLMLIYEGNDKFFSGIYKDEKLNLHEITSLDSLAEIDQMVLKSDKISKKIQKGNNITIGRIDLFYTEKHINQRLSSLIKKIIFQTLIISFFTILIGYIVLKNIIIHPIHIMINAMKEIENDNLDTQIRIYTKDEFGILAHTFNNMTEQLKLSRKNLVEQERIKNQLEIAEKIQTSLLPVIPKNDELEISALMKPADEVGGDYYDVSYDTDGYLWFAIGDVSEHGLTPGLIMMMAETSFISNLERNPHKNPRDVIISVNKILTENVRERLKESHFMTMMFLKYLGKGNFIYAGSHLDIIIYRSKEKKCQLLKTNGMYLSIRPDISNFTNDYFFNIDVGDCIFLYTDGIIESSYNGDSTKLFGIDNLCRIINDNIENTTIEALKNIILKEALEWCNYKQSDDMTIIILKRIV
ncbi:MAG: hypothetical protein A2086_01360 [Spirochaetes bacterium GWD1_27_9]|nr:MAG: hypothetical protein A2Z98_13315 [Spirochaetes bacterium GWB1_27_13]OHD24430.1 MAG: hypothetical protein A2Y34_04265 [Spirochaetes bacterium GWC1_27_15]OHD36923.1 MAG: hypothetical protein A2086_01360 [Spirochaetes bacterium GWD1_27_9]